MNTNVFYCSISDLNPTNVDINIGINITIQELYDIYPLILIYKEELSAKCLKNLNKVLDSMSKLTYNINYQLIAAFVMSMLNYLVGQRYDL